MALDGRMDSACSRLPMLMEEVMRTVEVDLSKMPKDPERQLQFLLKTLGRITGKTLKKQQKQEPRKDTVTGK